MTKEGVKAVPGTEGRFVTPSPNEPTQRVWLPGTAAQQAQAPEYEYKVNPLYPIAGGLAAGEFARRNPGPTLPTDTAIGARNIDMASAIGGDNLRFKLNPSVAAAQGGRIGYADAGSVRKDPEEVAKTIGG